MNSRRLMLTMAEMLQQHLQQMEKHLAASDQLIRDQRGPYAHYDLFDLLTVCL
jgi:hypothetical protein